MCRSSHVFTWACVEPSEVDPYTPHSVYNLELTVTCNNNGQLDLVVFVHAATVAEFKSFVLNNKAFGNLFCNSQNSFHTSPGSSDSNNRSYRSFFKLSNGIFIYQKILDVNFFVKAIVEFEK